MANKKNKILGEAFHDGMIDDLILILKASSNNIIKSEQMIDYLKPYGFKYVGRGTNILVMKHKKIADGLVFKIALDSYGVHDNYTDLVYTNEIKDYVTVYECHRTGMVSVHDFVRIIKNTNEAKRYYQQLRKMLKELKKDYLLCDLSLRTFKNFGLVQDGKKKNKLRLVIADGSDLIRLQQGVSLTCSNKLRVDSKSRTLKVKKCGGKLQYDEEFFELVCKDCGKAYNPTEIYTEKFQEVDVLRDKFFSLGMDDKEIKVLNKKIIKDRSSVSGNNETREESKFKKEVPVFMIEEEPDAIKKDIPVLENDECDWDCDKCKRPVCTLNHDKLHKGSNVGKDPDEDEVDDSECDEECHNCKRICTRVEGENNDEETTKVTCCQYPETRKCDSDCPHNYCLCNDCDTKTGCEAQYGMSHPEIDSEVKDSMEDLSNRLSELAAEELAEAEAVKNAIANGEKLPLDAEQSVFKQAPIYDGQDTSRRRDLDMLTDKNIRIELEQTGENDKLVEIVIDGKLPTNSNIKFNITQITDSGTEVCEFSILDLLEKRNVLQQY